MYGEKPSIVVEGGIDNPRREKSRPRARILSVAAELFHRHGIRAVGVEAIAEAADASKMTLYRHFASKDELIAQYLRHFTELADSELPAPADPAEALLLANALGSRRWRTALTIPTDAAVGSPMPQWSCQTNRTRRGV